MKSAMTLLCQSLVLAAPTGLTTPVLAGPMRTMVTWTPVTHAVLKQTGKILCKGWH